MTRSHRTFVSLVIREIAAISPMLALLASVAVILQVGQGFAPWARSQEAVSPFHEIDTLVTLIVIALLAGLRQADDLVGGRPRHLFSFPVSPLQVTAAKAGAFAAAAVVISALNQGLWVWLSAPTGPLRSPVGLLMLVTGQAWTALAMWVTILIFRRIPETRYIFLLVFTLPIVTPNVDWLSPALAALAFADPAASFTTGLTTAFAWTLITLAVLERHLALRYVE